MPRDKLGCRQDIDRHQSLGPLEVPVSRVQLALNVNDIDEAVAFYSRLFGTEPAKRRPGYANFAVAEPLTAAIASARASARSRSCPLRRWTA